MEDQRAVPGASGKNSRAARRDILIIVVFAAALGVLAAHYQLSERVYAYTRRWEAYQLDEWPIVAFALAIGLVWFARRRYLTAQHELQARTRAEALLASALESNRQLAQEHLCKEEAGQKHLARELHDELSQYTNAIKLDAMTLLQDASRREACEAGAGRIVKAVDHMHRVVSDIVRRLRPVGLDELGLSAALEHCVAHWRQRLPDTAIVLTVDGDCARLGEMQTLTLYRLVQEALTNVSRHATARRVEVRLFDGPPVSATAAERVVLRINDDGVGSVPGKPHGGFGLRGMRERVAMLGGTLTIETAPQAGFALTADLPARDVA